MELYVTSKSATRYLCCEMLFEQKKMWMCILELLLQTVEKCFLLGIQV